MRGGIFCGTLPNSTCMNSFGSVGYHYVQYYGCRTCPDVMQMFPYPRKFFEDEHWPSSLAYRDAALLALSNAFPRLGTANIEVRNTCVQRRSQGGGEGRNLSSPIQNHKGDSYDFWVCTRAPPPKRNPGCALAVTASDLHFVLALSPLYSRRY